MKKENGWSSTKSSKEVESGRSRKFWSLLKEQCEVISEAKCQGYEVARWQLELCGY